MSLDDAVAQIAVHLGVVDESAIDNMSYIFFEDVLAGLGHKLTYDAVVNYAGNSFCEKAWDMITENHPFNVTNEAKGMNKKTRNDLAAFFGAADIKIKKSKKDVKK